MSAYNFLNYDGTLTPSSACKHDSNIGYEADFSRNGEVDGWDYYDGLHTYGCWNHFLFGTLYGSYALIGRYNVFSKPVEAESFYTIRLVMKISLAERSESAVNLPTKGRLAWRTISSPVWNSDKELDFDLDVSDGWVTYHINMGEAQWWQGDVNDLRIYPILEHGIDGDEVLVRAIEILSVSSYECLNTSCDYYTSYEHNCPGVGERGYCKSQALAAYTSEGSTFDFVENKFYTIREDINDTLLVNMNGYGFENIVIDPVDFARGGSIANTLSKAISKLDVGGYAEATVEYTEQGEFVIYNGVYADDSTVEIGDNQLARDLNFFDNDGNDISTKHTGSNPASGFGAYSPFKIKTHQIYSLLDKNEDSEFYFNPFIYNVEGGRQDWLEMGLGKPSVDVRTGETEDSGTQDRLYEVLENGGKTIIDFTHPFNASGRIVKIYAAITLDNFEDGSWESRGAYDSNRKDTQLQDAKIMFFRPLKDGSIKVLDKDVAIPNRDHDAGNLYSSVQEYVDIDCDIFINKGDLIGVYNANVYRSRSISGEEIDALYYQVDGKASGVVEVRQPQGTGAAGLLLYARSDEPQNRLVLELDLGKRINIDNIQVYGSTEQEILEYNVARCLDINWQVDLFDGDHSTGWIRSYRPIKKAYYNHANLAYGIENLSDGIKTVPDGKAADGFQIDLVDNGYRYFEQCNHRKDGGDGVIPTNPKYFWVNGDVEWLSTYHHAERTSPFLVGDFSSDPIAFTLKFPLDKDKLIYKYKVYFKEQYNFRSFAASIFKGEFYTFGDADDNRFDLIPYRQDGTETPWTAIRLDGIEYRPENDYQWENINLYLATNPIIGHKLTEATDIGYVDGGMFEGMDMSYYDELAGLSYYQNYRITNGDQYTQSLAIDWTVLEFEWPEQYGKGFRLYVDNHHSTKVCELEVFCKVENVASAMAGSIEITHSAYGDYWWSSENSETSYGVNAFIGDTPQYANIVIKPITEMRLSDVIINVSSEDVYLGEKGCQYQYIPTEAKRGVDNPPQKIEFKNVYGRPYDLYVDIASPELTDEGMVFYSLMNDQASIENPVVGADSFYRKHEDFLIEHYDKNVAINCPVWALSNLVEGADAWYSHDNEHSWRYYGKVDESGSIDFSNLPDATITTLYTPVLTRSKWWKIGFLDPRIVASIKEIQVHYNEEEISGIQFYHHKDADAYTTPNSDTAPHLNNGIVDGSYYVLKGDHYIGFELPTSQPFDKIVFYHDNLNDYENSHDIAGIDKATALCIHGVGDTYQTDSILDSSYFEHEITVVGSGIYCDEGVSEFDYSFTEDFDTCISNTQTFDAPPIDTSYWTNIINATITSGTLDITNSGIQGQVETIDYIYGDFMVDTKATVSGAYDGQGWGCFLEVFNAAGEINRIGKTFRYFSGDQIFSSEEYSSSGWRYIAHDTETSNEDLTLQLRRDAGVVEFWAGRVGQALTKYGESTVLGNDPVKFRLISLLTPLAPTGVYTTCMFDEFTLDNTAADWSTDVSENSEFTCVSGIGPSGNAYWYDIGCRNSSSAAGFKRVRIYDNNSYPLDYECDFTFKFTFRADEFLDNYNNSTATNCAVSVGLLGTRARDYSIPAYSSYFTGVQAVLLRDDVKIAVLNEWTDVATSSNYTLDTAAQFYYAELNGDGAGHYELYVWTDTWDGSNMVVSGTLDSSINWTASKVGVGSAHGDRYYNKIGRGTGWVGDFDFVCHKYHENRVLHKSSVKFSGNPSERLLVDYDNSPGCNVTTDNFYFGTKKFTIDFYISFNTLPPNEGDYVVICQSWEDGQSYQDGDPLVSSSSWALILVNESNDYKIQFYVNNSGICKLMLEFQFNPDCYRWHHFYLCRGPKNDSDNERIVLLRDGHYMTNEYFPGVDVSYSGQDIVIGKNLDGHIEEFRISCDEGDGGGRLDDYYDYPEDILKQPPTSQYERYYTMSLYNSSDNVSYGKSFDVDVWFSNSYSYFVSDSRWSRQYYTYFAIDFGRRHALGIVRSFPVGTAYQFTITDNILYSNKDTEDPSAAFLLTEEEEDPSTDFSGLNYSYPTTFTMYDTTKARSYIIDDTFFMTCTSDGATETAHAYANFYFYENFDIHIDYALSGSHANNDTWKVMVEVLDVNDEDKFGVRLIRGFVSGSNMYRIEVKDDSSSWVVKYVDYLSLIRGTMRVRRVGEHFEFYTKDPFDDFSDFTLISTYTMLNSISPEMHMNLKLQTDSPSYPDISVWWDNFTVTEADLIYSTSQDARWAKVKMLNGDGEEKTIEYVGMYPDITKQLNAFGQWNCRWTELGTSITSYADAENVAIGATASGSSYVGVMYADNAIDGLISEAEFNSCWGCYHDDDGMWLEVHLRQETEIFRVKVFHGYSDTDFNNLITDYKIQVSTDGETFSTIFNVTDNDEMIRIHDLSTPVSAKVVRLWIDDYDAINRFVFAGGDDIENNYQFWNGPVLREIEIYEYYGFTIINSQDTPVIAIDLQAPFFVEGHELIGVDSENSKIDWSNDDSNFAWSNSHFDDPHKVTFGDWGGDPGYAKWAVIQRNTAYGYPTMPDYSNPYTDTEDYLKHAVINASVNEDGKAPNPVEYPWFWRSNVSELSYDYDQQTGTGFIVRSLKIDYPASTDAEHVRYIEGDTFGWDDVASWRDGFGFFVYIDDINNLDLEYGYFYLGGFDYTTKRNPVVYRWNTTTFSGALQSGWNNLNLTFLYADEIVYTELDNDDDGRDPRRLYSINWGKMGFVFRGKGQALTMAFEGFFIERNHFEHGCFPGQQGLYLHANDIMKVPCGELDFHSGAVEFWIRPDWNWDGRDIYGDFKFRSLFHFSNVANDVLGAVVSTEGLQVYYGNLLNDFNMFIISGLDINPIDMLLHMAFVFSNDGTGIGEDASTIRVYINNAIVAKNFDTWSVTDNKHFNFMLGGQSLLALKSYGFDPNSSAVDGVVSRLKFHNYCKTDYADAMPDYDGDFVTRILKPNDFIAISKDNVTFHKVGSSELPFFFEDVPADNSIPIWVRVNVPRFGLTGKEKRTAELLASWDIGV